jgi:hypothetical protein
VATVNGVSITSDVATVTGDPQLYFIQNPDSLTVAQGRSAALNALMAGRTPLIYTYRWLFNGTAIPGGIGPTLLLDNVTQAQAGTYTCVATWNPLGNLQNPPTATSAAATLTVVATSNPGYLANLSARGIVGSGGGPLIGGFSVGGTGVKQLLVRGVGPALTRLGVSGFLSAPQLDIVDASQVEVGSARAWGAPPTQGPSGSGMALSQAGSPLMDSVGAFSLSAGSADAAVAVGAPPGSSTVQVSGVGGASGVALVEVYDADPGNPNARLVNLSARANVRGGMNVLVGGFVIGGSTADTLLIRAVGPGLTDQFGLSGVLAQPVLTIFDSSQNPVASNAGWENGSWADPSVFTLVGAFVLNSINQDSALLVSLPPGAYTAQVSGLNGGTGLALFEIYEVP